MFPYANTPEELGISSKGLLAYIDAVERYGQEIHGLMLLRHGKVALEMAWKPYDTVTPHTLFSLSKSFTSTAVGLAVSEGYFSLDDTVAKILPDKLPAKPSDRLLAVTVADLLCMGSGLAPASDSIDPNEPDFAKHTLSFPVDHKPGTHFHYNSLGTFLLSQIVQAKTGQTVRDFLVPRLFTPLGIRTPEWEASPLGVSLGGWGLHLSVRDIAAFGQLLLQDGVWEGNRLLPEGWVRLATSKRIDNSGRSGNPDWEQGYGYQFWRCRGGHYRGDGMYGQLCWVMPEQGAVVAVTAGIRDMGKEADLLHEYLIPSIGAAPADAATQQALKAHAAALFYPFPAAGPLPPKGIEGVYRAQDGSQITLSLKDDVLCRAGRDARGGDIPPIRFGHGKPIAGSIALGYPMPKQLAYQAAYGVRDQSLHLLARCPGSPFVYSAKLAFADDTLTETVRSPGFEREEPILYRR